MRWLLIRRVRRSKLRERGRVSFSWFFFLGGDKERGGDGGVRNGGVRMEG